MTDERILSGMQAGQQEALEALMQKYRRYVTTVIANIIGSCSETDELVSDVFYSIWTHAGSIRSGALKPYLGTTARNTAKSYLRKKRILPMDIDTIELPDMDSDPENQILREELARKIKKALGKLSPKDRKIFLYHYYYLKSSEEISQLMHIPSGTVRSRLSRGRKVLKEVLGKEDFP